MIEKLQDRVPLKSAIGKCSSCLGPHNMINHKDVCILKSKKPLEKLCKNNSMTPVEADNSKNDFPNILTLAQQHQEKFEGFNKHTQRLFIPCRIYSSKFRTIQTCGKSVLLSLPSLMGKAK